MLLKLYSFKKCVSCTFIVQYTIYLSQVILHFLVLVLLSILPFSAFMCTLNLRKKKLVPGQSLKFKPQHQ